MTPGSSRTGTVGRKAHAGFLSRESVVVFFGNYSFVTKFNEIQLRARHAPLVLQYTSKPFRSLTGYFTPDLKKFHAADARALETC